MEPKMQVEQIILQPTPYCNLDCKYCYLPDRQNKSRMSPDLPADVLNFIVSSGLASPEMQIVWHAGEPLAAGLKFYQQATDKISALNLPYSISHSIQTNATLINESWCSFFKEANFTVGVSLDGPQFLHDHNRVFASGKGSFELTMRGLRLLQQHGLNPNIIAVISSKSLDYPDQIYDFFLEVGISHLGINIEEDEGINRSKTIHAPDFIQKCFAFFERLYERNKTGKLVIRETEWIKNLMLKPKRKMGSMLNEPFRILNVDYKGDFSTFCPELLGMSHKHYGSFVLGNIYKTAFSEVVSSPKFRQIDQDIQMGVKNCKETCEYFFLCGGGTPTNKLYENGSFQSTETFNCIAKIKIPVQVILPALEKEAGIAAH